MPAIEQITHHNTLSIDPTRKRIQELKARAAEGLDDALSVVARNLGREEAQEAHNSLKELGDELRFQAVSHNLDAARVADLISDPFGDD